MRHGSCNLHDDAMRKRMLITIDHNVKPHDITTLGFLGKPIQGPPLRSQMCNSIAQGDVPDFVFSQFLLRLWGVSSHPKCDFSLPDRNTLCSRGSQPLFSTHRHDHNACSQAGSHCYLTSVGAPPAPHEKSCNLTCTLPWSIRTRFPPNVPVNSRRLQIAPRRIEPDH